MIYRFTLTSSVWSEELIHKLYDLRLPHAESNISDGFVGVTKPFKKVSRQLTIDLNVS
jgi:hypothetical protein